MRARPAVPADADAVARIYNQGIEERIATFETRPRTVKELRPWFGGRRLITEQRFLDLAEDPLGGGYRVELAAVDLLHDLRVLAL